jgi:hypothetical protein
MEDWVFNLLELYYSGIETSYFNLQKEYAKKYDSYKVTTDDFVNAYNQIKGAHYIVATKRDSVNQTVYKISPKGIDRYNLEKQKRNKEIERQELNDRMLKIGILSGEITRRLYLTNVWIALAGIIAAIYYGFSLFDFYQKHSLNWQFAAYFLSGLGLGLLIWLLISQLKRISS